MADLMNRYWVALAQTPGVSPRSCIDLLATVPDISDLYRMSAMELVQRGFSKQAFSVLASTDWRAIDQQLTQIAQMGVQLLPYNHADYPQMLREIAVPPLLLYVLGDRSCLQRPQLAMVGSRNPTPQGLKHAYNFAYELSSSGLAIVSGLALGIDGAAHTGALAATGITIGVLGTGLDQIYPATHRDLAQRIVQNGGALISEFPFGEQPKRDNFPRRNRLISGLSYGVFVVEAAIQSGSLITARFALEQGKDVFALPGSVHNPVARGCHALLRQGAKLVETTQDILEELPFLTVSLVKKQALTRTAAANKQDNKAYPLAKQMEKLLASLDERAASIDELTLLTGLSSTELTQCLLALELEGKVVGTSIGYQRI
jgi:DNA processing protein